MQPVNAKWQTWFAASLFILGLASPVWADDKPANPAQSATNDQRLFDTLRDVIDRGAELYNNGDPNGCYRFFQGALIVARPQFHQRPDLQKSIDAALDEAGRMRNIGARAFALHKTLNDVRAKINPKKPADISASNRKPIEVKPVDKKPTETKPAAVAPTESKPLDKKPLEAKPLDSKPAATEPDLKPLDLKPVEPKPEPAKPVDKKPETTKPVTKIPDLTPVAPAAKPDDAEITGKITFRTMPVKKGTIQLVALENGAPQSPEVTINQDGTYSLKGVKPGTYVVLLKGDADGIKATYGDPKRSPLRTVVTKGKQVHNIELMPDPSKPD
jgi:hypothetical protein